ncbi:MAG: DUF1203 domain-containing protein [Pikeienuella sp.]
MSIQFRALTTDLVAAIRAQGPDANGHRAESAISNGKGVPCRYCLCDIPAGDNILVLAHRPFAGLHPYAETGPIFLCAECERREDAPSAPPVIETRTEMLVKAYGVDERIRYGTGQITPTDDIPAYCEALLNDRETATVHIRSATNNCFICRVDRV